MKLRNLSLTNYRGISNCKIEFHPRMNIIIGNNGMGKTSILDSCALLLNRAILIPQNNITFKKKRDLKRNKTTWGMHISFESSFYESNNETHTVEYSSKKSHYTLNFLEDRRKKLIDIVEENAEINIPMIAYYGTDRVVINTSFKKPRTKHHFNQLNGYDSSLTAGANFNLFNEWYRTQDDNINRNFRYTGKLVDSLDPVNKAITKFTGFENIKLSKSGTELLLTKTMDNSEINLDMELLSQGEKIYITLIGDIARRLMIMNPFLPNSLDGVGIILIDEVELHLHPVWQREILQKLTEVFPNCQFIVTTHSPQVITSVENANIYVLEEEIFSDSSEDNYILPQKIMYGKTSNQILEEIMGANERNVEIKSKIQEIYDLLDSENFDNAKVKIDRLKSIIDGTDRVIKELETTLEILKL